MLFLLKVWMFFDWQDFGWFQIKNKYTDMYLTIPFFTNLLREQPLFFGEFQTIYFEIYIFGKLHRKQVTRGFFSLENCQFARYKRKLFLEWLKWLRKIINLKFRLANVGKIKAINYAGDNSRTSRPPQLNSSMRNAYINIKHAYFALIPEPLHHYIARVQKL